MERIKIPYHNGFQEVEIPRKNIAAFLKPKAGDCLPQLTESDIVARALDNPVGSEGLEKLVVGKENMVIITSAPGYAQQSNHAHFREGSDGQTRILPYYARLHWLPRIAHKGRNNRQVW